MSKKGHVPVRMCVGCRQRKQKGDLIRLIRTSEGLTRDRSRGGDGRGFYLCRDLSCLKKARKRYPIPLLLEVEG